MLFKKQLQTSPRRPRTCIEPRAGEDGTGLGAGLCSTRESWNLLLSIYIYQENTNAVSVRYNGAFLVSREN